jgi:hypothetical protein
MYYIILILLFLQILASGFGSELRYIKYILSFLLMLLIFLPNKTRISKILINNMLFYIFLFLTYLIFVVFGITDYKYFSSRFFAEFFFIISPFFFLIGIESFGFPKSKFIHHFAIINILGFVIICSKGFIELSSLSSIFNAFISSSLPTESGMAFPLGLFTLYFYLNRQKTMFIILLVFFLLAFKRVAILALIISFISHFIIPKLKNNESQRFKITLTAFLALANLAFIKIVLLFSDGYFDDLIKDYTGLSSNAFSMGRMTLFSEIFEILNRIPFFGSGIGSTFVILKGESLLHSDTLKLFIELGPLFFVIWVVAFYIMNLKKNQAIPILLFTNILFLTDNVIIYFDTMIVFYLILTNFDDDYVKLSKF